MNDRNKLLSAIAQAIVGLAVVSYAESLLAQDGVVRITDNQLRDLPSPANGIQDIPAVPAAAPATVSPAVDLLGELDDEPLPPLEEELRLHGGAHLYAGEGDGFRPDAADYHDHVQVLRLPDWWENPNPVTGFADFDGADKIQDWPGAKWFGDEGYQWEPRFVGHGSYSLFGFLLEQNGTRQDGIGHQLIVDLDLRVTGTERAHVQFRPFGRENSGGSFYQFSDPADFDDNSTLIPDRWWIEGEFYSMFGGLIDDQFTPLDYHITAGKVPFRLHNSLLVNDEMTGVILTKNTLIIPPLANLNVQGFYFFDDVNSATPQSTDLVGMHAQADWRHAFIEGTFAYVSHSGDKGFDSRYGALSATKFFGPLSLAGRALFKDGDERGRGDGALYVLESNFTRSLSPELQCSTGIEYAVFYANLFRATSGWNTIAGANLNRLRSTFAVDPLVRIAQGQGPSDTQGVSLGVQLFREHEDESFIPEIAYEEPQGDSVWGVGLRWQRKLGPRVYIDALGVLTWSKNEALDREGIFVSTVWVF